MIADHHEVVISWDTGGENVLRVSETETVLEAAGRQVLEVPFSCRWGACARCLARLLDGEIEYTDHPRVLEKYGYDQYPRVTPDPTGTQYVLLCIAQPRSDCRVEIGPNLSEELSFGT